MRVTFVNQLGLTIVGELIEAGAQAPIVVFSHGMGSGKASPRSVPIANTLHDHGIGSLLVDLTGHGESEGTKEQATTDQWADDLRSAIKFLTDRGYQKFGLSGASFGGAAALMAAVEEPLVKAIVLRYSTMNACFSFKRPCYELAPKMHAPTLLIVGELDHPILEENQQFLSQLTVEKRLEIIPGAVHAFDEPDQIAAATQVSVDWFGKHLEREAKAIK